MKFAPDLFPYPVLNSELDDYIGSSFSVDYDIEKETQSTLAMDIVYKLNDTRIQELIKEGKAMYAVHLEGVASSYREIYTTINNKQRIVMDAENLSGTVEINFFIIATVDIKDYGNTNFNTDYYDKNFVVKKIKSTDILAYENAPNLNIEFENRLISDQESMIWVTSANQKFMSVDMDGDIIQVRLSKKSYESYFSISQSSSVNEQLLLIGIVQPALTYVIDQVQKSNNYSELRWYQSLEEMLNQINISTTDFETMDSMKLAQQLLDYPLESALVDFYEWEENRNDY